MREQREAAEKTLLPCPFCGSSNLRIGTTANANYAYCTQCGCSGGWGAGIQGAIKKWNKRTAPANHGEEG
jgi:Lar family restriction alleviation protein